MAMALSAAVAYSRGVSRAILGERRSSLLGSCGIVLVGWAMGSIAVAGAEGGPMGAPVGGVLLHVCR